MSFLYAYKTAGRKKFRKTPYFLGVYVDWAVLLFKIIHLKLLNNNNNTSHYIYSIFEHIVTTILQFFLEWKDFEYII